jgi:hypothetical protein
MVAQRNAVWRLPSRVPGEAGVMRQIFIGLQYPLALHFDNLRWNFKNFLATEITEITEVKPALDRTHSINLSGDTHRLFICALCTL